MNNYPLTAFHFKIQFTDFNSNDVSDSGFIHISGLKIESLQDEGNKARYNPILLRRGVNNSASPLRDWILESLAANAKKHSLSQMQIQILDEEHKPVKVFILHDITPVSWQLGELNADKSELLTEDIVLQYRSVEVK